MFRGQAIGGLGRLGESGASGRVTLWSLDLVELVIHAGFPIRLCDGQRSIVKGSIAAADIAAHEQRPIGLAQRTEAVRNARERANHARG